MAKAAGQRKRSTGWPRAAASAAIFRGRQVLLVRRGKAGLAPDLWSLPGGHIEPGETARAAALREVREETGVVAELAGLVDIHEVIRHGPAGDLAAHYLLAVFYGLWVSGEPTADSDVTAARFVALDAVPALPTTDGAPHFIRRAWSLLEAAGR